ncbi:S8 family serine peptidase [Oceanobacillus luteolus]|uniref:S8 family serine peptidase n=1 Tax=Oceanobacillus luteolus TaxID=1274358 RepID=UPI002559DA58|nr:S8 family serine peptidase [Oceanobacillus luteolus]
MQNLTSKLLSFFMITVLLLSTFLPGTSISAELNHQSEKIASELLDEFAEKDEASFLVMLKEKPDVEKVAEEVAEQANTLSEDAVIATQREAVVTELKETAETSQQEVIELLDTEAEQGNAEEVKPYYIVNSVAVTGTKEVAEKLNELEEVERIIPNKKHYLHNTQTKKLTNANDLWNLRHLNVRDVWEQGYDGTGIVVATIDSGVEWQHPALKANYRGYNAETGSVNHAYSWYDAVGDATEPTDVIDHGTHVTGTMVGVAGEQEIGVAPGAQWIAVRAFDRYGNASDTDLLEAAEWILNPTDKNGVERPDLAPDIVNNSWGGGSGYDEFYRDIVKAWNAAGITSVFSAGNAMNYKPEPGSVESPANYPESFAVGAIDEENRLAPFSKLGPSPYGEIKPDVVAPGVNIYSSILDGRYGTKPGTSMASPHVSGLVALLKQADKNLTVEDTKRILKQTATPLTDSNYSDYPNNGFGYGLINAQAAMQQVLEEKDKAVSRISGYLRYDTAIEISRRGWDSTDTVVLARGDDFADALTAVPLAFKLDAPILLTGTNKLYNETLREIKRLKASNVVIIGGTGAISEGIYTTLANEGLNVRRLYGSSRTETAAIIAEEVAPNGSEQAFVVNGYDFPDALSAAPYAANQGIPILVSQTNKLPVATIKALDSLNVQESMVIGGASVVTESVKSKLPQPTRISGKDRYETNILLAEHFNPNVESMYVATGTNFADSLAGATLAAKNNTGILLVHHRIPESVKNFITENGVQELTIFGGKAAVSEEIRKDLLKLLQ